MLPPVFQALKASQAVKDIVGTNPPRVFRHDSVPQDTQRPYISWFLVTGSAENQLSGLPMADRCSVQVDCWHADDAGVVRLATAARDAIEPRAHMTGVVINTRDRETRLYRIGMQFDWLLHRDAVSSD